MNPRQSAENQQLSDDHVPSPPIPTKEGCRFIPDDLHRSQGMSAASMSFFWRAKTVTTPAIEVVTHSSSSKLGFIRNPADHS